MRAPTRTTGKGSGPGVRPVPHSFGEPNGSFPQADHFGPPRSFWHRYVAMFGLILIGLSITLAGTGIERAGRRGIPSGPPPPFAGDEPTPTPTTPPRTPFEFALDRITPVRVLDGAVGKAARTAAQHVQDTLSGLYDTAFADPRAWEPAIPAGVWEAFAPAVRQQARRDSASFTLSAVPTALQELHVTDASLAVQVLLGPTGRAEAALARVGFVAVGDLLTGQALEVRNSALLFLRPVSGRWLIVGYPVADSELGPAPRVPPHGVLASRGEDGR
jgi:hypothetical protein